ncbi:FAD-binding domain-containing protein [Exidia glandulosa HHB12029]|uniref:FAD-binding domain-containing protein n=1 Tax=Exidia glandulosa HHB12029 TaxID=1314781 RepID=A0A165NR02_EXIGL|nr:FAD-binding domain-containing protein [Exidia glandulosa HHB12029]
MILLYAATAACLSALASATIVGLDHCLLTKVSPASTVVLPLSPGYLNATTSTNLSWEYYAAAIVFVATPEDAAAAIKCAAAHKVPVTPRGGRHSYASFGSGGRNGALVVDVTALRNVTYDANTGYATVGAGLRLGDLALALDAYGRATPHGTCPLVGIGGHATCGGFGDASRQWGLLTDQIVGVTAVSATGDILHVDESHHPDLLWAIRGAAPSFATVLSFTIKTYPQPTVTTYYIIEFGNFSNSPDIAAQALSAYQSFAATSAPPELGIRFRFSRQPTLPLDVMLNGVYYGSQEDFTAAIQPLLDSLPFQPVSQTISTQSYIESVVLLAVGDPLNSTDHYDTPNTAYLKSILVPTQSPLSDDTWSKFVDFAFNTEIPDGIIYYFWEIDIFGGSFNGKPTAIPSLSPDVNAFGGRDGLILMQQYVLPLSEDPLHLLMSSLSSGTYAGGDPGKYPAGGRTFANNFAGAIINNVHAEGKEVKAYACYVEYASVVGAKDFITDAATSPLLSADQAHALYYGPDHTRRLKDLKRKWDPARVFDFPHAF